jgi:short-subunit dehydrogenase
MRVELAAKDITVTTVIPGLMRTGSARNAQFKGRHRAEYAWFAIGAATPLVTIGDIRAAKQIVDALRHGDPEVVLSLPAKLAVRAAAFAPGFVQRVLTLVDRALPDGDDPEIHAGFDSESSLAPSRWTTLGDRAARRNNEL